MSEYIVEMPKEPAKVVRDGWNVRVEWQYKQREEIVRCRDCEHISENHYRDMLGFGRETIVYRCDYFWNADELPEVEPDGFCAWAVRKVDA